MAKRGWFTARPDRVRRIWLIIGCALFVTGTVAIVAMAARSRLGLIPIPVALAGLVLIGCARWMPMRTAKGTELRRRLLGFRRYLTTQAARQTDPTGQADLLDDYLPYAIVFGCTQQWADVTGSLADSARRRHGTAAAGHTGRATCPRFRSPAITSRQCQVRHDHEQFWPLRPSLLGVPTGATVLVALLARSSRPSYQVTRRGLRAAAMVRILAA